MLIINSKSKLFHMETLPIGEKKKEKVLWKRIPGYLS